MRQQPLVSIITVVYNGEALLERTILSVLQQTYPNIEYIIIDGGSTDRTVEIIQKYANRLYSTSQKAGMNIQSSFLVGDEGRIDLKRARAISHWISEPDKGIYDAMNKGMQQARGDYLFFLNAGDEIYSPATLREIFENFEPDADVYYGETVLVDAEGRILGKRSELTPHKLPEDLSWTSLRKGMAVCHQSFLVRRELAPQFDSEFKYTADIDWMITCLKKSKDNTFTHSIISKYLAGGLSDQYRLISWIYRFYFLKKHFGLFSTIYDHLFIVFRAIVFSLRPKISIKTRKGPGSGSRS